MTSLEESLFIACTRGDIESVKCYLERGANMNMICSTGRTPFGTAAQLGNTAILKVFLDSCQDKRGSNHYQSQEKLYHSSNSKRTKSSRKDKSSSNLGYFVYVHKDKGSGRDTKTKKGNTDRNQNKDIESQSLDPSPSYDCYQSISDICSSSYKYDSLSTNQLNNQLHMTSLDDAQNGDEAVTPDDMDNLEWDMEVEGDEQVQTDDPWGALYLWYAGILSQTSILLEEKPVPTDIDREDQYGRRAIHYAAIEGHLEALKLLIDAGCNVNVGDSDNLTPLHLAAARDSPEVLKLLIDAGANVNHKTTDKTAPLHVSASRGFIDNVKLLLSSGAHIDTLDSSDRTPLFMAVSRGHFHVISFLLKHGAKVNIEEIHGYTPLCEAVWQKEVQIVKKLLHAGAKITQSHYLLHYAILHHHEEMVRLLLQAGSIINLRDVNGDTPLIVAVQTGQRRTVELLLENGASVNCSSYITGNTPLHEAVDHCRTNQSFNEMFSILKKYKINLDSESEAGYTPLYLAIVHEKYYAAEVLIRHGADVNHCRKPYLLNVFYYLIHRENMLLAKLLIYAGHKLHSSVILTENSTPVDYWIHEVKTNPMRLTDMCRIKIRTHLKNDVYEKVSKMALPLLIKKFLKLEDINSND